MSIFEQLNKELHEFFNTKVHIAGTRNNDNARYLGAKNKSYEFSQWEMINLIDLYWNSKFETGQTDSEGQRKIFLNKVHKSLWKETIIPPYESAGNNCISNFVNFISI